MQWYYSNNATQLGPVPDAELRAKLASGEVGDSDLVWREGMKDWLPVSSVPELRVVPQGGGNPYQSPGFPAPLPTSGLAIASLVCGVVGLSCTILPGIAAIICGHLALREISAPNAQVTGRGFAIAGLVLGYLSIVMMAVMIMALVFGIFSKIVLH